MIISLNSGPKKPPIPTISQPFWDIGNQLSLVTINATTGSFLISKTFASLVFFVERDSEFKDGKWTFLDSVWWGILTVTTVGHHVK